MNYKERFYSKYVSSHNSNLYGETTLENIKSQFYAFQKHYGKFLPWDKNIKVADLGCGDGGLVYWLQEKGYTNAEGVDVSAEQIELGKKLGIKKLYKEDIKEFLKSKENYFDLIFLRDVLGHFEKSEILEILDLVFKSLNSSGVLVVKTPNAESPMSGRLRYGDFTHDTSFTGTSLCQVLLVTGFKKVDAYSVRPTVHGFLSFIRAVLWVCIEIRLRLYRLIEAGSWVGIFTQNVIVAGEK